MNKQKAFSLVELLIALSLGSLLTLVILEAFQLQKESISSVRSMNESQANIQFVHKLFSDSVRLSGYFGGVSSRDIDYLYLPLKSYPGSCNSSWVFDLSSSLGGAEGAKTAKKVDGLPDDCLPKDYLPYSDVIWLKYADPLNLYDDSEVDNKINAKRYFLRAESNEGAILFDGRSAVQALEKIPRNERVYNRQIHIVLFYISRCLKEECHHKGSTLSQIVLLGNRFIKRDLVNGVDQMQFEYGVDLDKNGFADIYMTASDVDKHWDQVISVKVYLLMRQSTPERDFKDSKHILGELSPGNYSFEPLENEVNYKRRIIEFEVARRNNLLELLE